MTPSEIVAALNVSHETADRLTAFIAVLEKWNRAINLVSRRETADIWTRHVFDSAQIFPLAPTSARRWADLGTGGGFPGLVCAILAQEQTPELAFDLIESDQRKAAFLREAVRITDVNARVIAQRIESVDEAHVYDVVSARALAPLATLFTLAAPLIAPGGVQLFLKGVGAGDELTKADPQWHSRCDLIPSRFGPGGVIVRAHGAAS